MTSVSLIGPRPLHLVIRPQITPLLESMLLTTSSTEDAYQTELPPPHLTQSPVMIPTKLMMTMAGILPPQTGL